MKFRICHALIAVALLAPAGAMAAAGGIDLAAIDRSVRPGDDFDAFASGAWRARTTIPPDRQSVGTVEDLGLETQFRIRELLEAAARSPTNPDEQLAGGLYGAFMDEAAVQRAGDARLRAELARLAGITDKAAMAEFMGQTQLGFGRGFFVCDVWVDLKNPRRPALRVRQDGLGLDYREIYDDARTVEAYRAYVERLLMLIGWPDAGRAAADIVALERAIAAGSWTVAENGDRVKRYNPMSLAELSAFAPGYAWSDYFRGLGVKTVPAALFVQQKSAMPKIAAVYAATPLETLKAWEAFQIADKAAPFLTRPYREAQFAFRGKVLDGVEAAPPRWKDGVAAVGDALPDSVGRIFVERYFKPEARAAVERMAATFKTAMANRIEALDWMSPQTKAVALTKLRAVRVMIGYPRIWRDYAGLSVDHEDLAGSIARIHAANWRYEIAKLDRPASPDEWFLPAQAVDAFSDQARAAIGVPAGILQPPIYDPAADDAVNFGSLGEVIGHELTHQFDDQGRKYGPTGALLDWWTPADAARFEAAAAGLAAQFDRIEVLPGVHLNGRQTLSENIADLGGLLLALDAYHLSLGGKPAPVIGGLTGDQRVFLSWARVFRSKEREETLRSQAASGTHTPFRFRSTGPMRNIDAWYTAFDIGPDQRFYLAPQDRARIW